ncbi:MAG TPA: amidohydrolase, partial [Devosia sp.]|nr:amidohydrolase [Devosia sp.]
PELLYDVHRTAGKVEELLRTFGVDDIVTGLGKTGVVGVIRGKSNKSGRVIGLRADMDALPIHETTGKPYASKTEGKMHACGHDGHTAMLLGAARYLAETRNFDGTAIVIFQPAEEGGAGGKAMVDDGLMEKFGIEQVFGMHNMPGLPVGHFAIREGGLLAATDEFSITITGRGGHAALPQLAVDPVVISSQIVMGLQTLVSRNVDPIESAVLTVGQISAGNTFNVIPAHAELKGTIRSLNEDVRALLEQRFRALVSGMAQAMGAEADITFKRGYPVTMNAPEQTRFALGVAQNLVGENKVIPDIAPIMGGEDFSFMAQARPAAFILMGNGDSAMLHQDSYDFNDEAIPVGCSYWVQLVETALPAA